MRKNRKRVLAMFLALVMCLSLAPVPALAENMGVENRPC